MITLVLLPGMDGTGVLFQDFAAAVRGEFNPVIVSYPDDPSLGFAELEPIARAALPSGRPFLLLGESFSGPIAISIAASSPPGLAGLILCCTFARSPHPWLPAAARLLNALPAFRVPFFLQRRNLFGRLDSPRLRAQLLQVRTLVSAKTLMSRLDAVARIDVSEKLRRVAVPALYLRAKRDRVVPLASCSYIKKIHPAVEVAEFDAAHLLLQTVPQAGRTSIAEFVDRRVRTLQ